MDLRTPVAMLVFNRPEVTARVLERVRAARPARLLVVADGPRRDRPGEAARCAAVRALFDDVGWPCEVEREYADENLGCRARIASGLRWIFGRVEEAILLEDDCLPHPDFFPFCEELLARYRDDPRVLAITGDNFQGGAVRGEGSYYFSRYLHVWGWATWRRTIEAYDPSLREWPALRGSRWLEDVLGDRAAARTWRKIFDRTHARAIDTWDYQMVFALWRKGGLVATPNRNLVQNLGLGAADATHPTHGSAALAVPAAGLGGPLVHPRAVVRDAAADDHVQRLWFSPSVTARLRDLWSRLLPARPAPRPTE